MDLVMESSIAEHLRVERTIPKRKSDAFTPPYPSFSARFDPSVTHVVMAYHGLQYVGETMPADAVRALEGLVADCDLPGGPSHADRASYVDEAGFTTVVSILYWTDLASWGSWRARVPSWTADERHSPDVGFFTEIVTPSVDRFETLFSSDRLEGVATAASDGLSADIQEHAYWGGARDRMPLGQTDPLLPVGSAAATGSGRAIRVAGVENLCLIRSGQEWTETEGEERGMYVDDVEPVLREGMDFLRDDGREIGCYANRYLQHVDGGGRTLDKTFGMSWWHSLEDLETWSESHPTHVAIFRAAMKYLTTMGPAAHLRLYHEVTVLTADQQEFTYLGCHDRTGMLRAL